MSVVPSCVHKIDDGYIYNSRYSEFLLLPIIVSILHYSIDTLYIVTKQYLYYSSTYYDQAA